MAEEREILFKIGSQDASKAEIDQAIGNLRRVEAENLSVTEKMQAQWSKIKEHWVGIAAASYALYAAVKKAWDLASLGAEYSEQRGLLDNLAVKYGTTAEEIVSAMQRASDGMISRVDLMGNAMEGLSKKLSPEQMINLAEAATVLGDHARTDAATALQDLTQALETGKTRALLPYLGTTLDLEVALGKETSQLTKAETAQAMYTLVMIEYLRLKREQKKAVDDTADSMERTRAGWSDMKLALGLLAKDVVKLTVNMLDNVAAMQTMQNQIFEYKKQVKQDGWTGSYGNFHSQEQAKSEDDLTAAYKRQLAELKKILQTRAEMLKSDKKEKASTQSNWLYMDRIFKLHASRRQRDADQHEQMAKDKVQWDDWQNDQILANMDAEQTANEISTRNAIELAQQKAAVETMIEQMKAQTIMSIIAAMYTFGAEWQTAAFYAEKAYAMVTAFINMKKGVAACLALGPAGLPFIPVIEGLGWLQIAAIAASTLAGPSASYGSSGGSAVNPVHTSSSKSTTSSTTETDTAAATETTTVKAGPTFQIIIQGNYVSNDRNARDLVKYLRKAIADGV